MSPSLGWRQLSVKLDAAQLQLLQAQTEMRISMQCTEPQQHAPGQLPSIWQRRLFVLVLASFCVCLLKVRQIATIAPLELLVVMLVGSTWQQFTGRSVYRTGSTALQ